MEPREVSSRSHPIGSMGLVHLPTWMVDFYGKCRQIYRSHGSYGHGSEIVSWCVSKPWKRTNSSPKKWPFLRREYIFQPSIFRGHVSFQGSTPWKMNGWFTYSHGPHEKKGTWSEPKLHYYLQHVNLQGCMYLATILVKGPPESNVTIYCNILCIHEMCLTFVKMRNMV